MSSSTTVVVTLVTSINDLPDELLSIISISAGPTEYCTLRRAMRRVWLYTTGREDHCIKHFLVNKVNVFGATRTTLCGKRHSIFDLPAVIWSDGTQYWCQHGGFHRDNNLPAIIEFGGTQVWFQHDKRHRDNDLPAAVHSDGTQIWYQHGKLHRDNDLPAIIWADGRQEWYRYGEQYTP